jgi:hypothetical protein
VAVADRRDLQLAFADPGGVKELKQRIEHDQRRALVGLAFGVAADNVVAGYFVK